MPDWTRYVRRRLNGLTTSPERSVEIAAELAQQLEGAYQDALSEGLSESDAAARAKAQFPDWEVLVAEINGSEAPAVRTLEPERGENILSGAMHDLRYALRLLRKNPGFALVACLTLALGIGANTAIFTVADSLILRPLPYPNPERLMSIETMQTNQPEQEAWTSAPDFIELREHTRAFASVAGVSPIWNNVLEGKGGAERLQSLYVSATFFPMLGVQPVAGRLFNEGEDQSGRANVVLVSHRLWQRRWGGDAGAVGQVLNLDGRPFTVAGVLPASFRYLGEPLNGTATEIDIWMPLAANILSPRGREVRWLKVIGLRRPGVAVEAARAELKTVTASLARQYPATNRGFVIDAKPLTAGVQGRLREPMFLLLAAVGLILFLACANVANLLLVRSNLRRKEISIRLALGASNGRILRQLAMEGFLLAAMGGAAGIVFAEMALRAMVSFGPAPLFQTRDMHLDGRALLFTAAVTLLAALFASLAPAWQRRERGSERGNTAQHYGLRGALVVAQVCVALTLLVGAGLLIHSFTRLLNVSPGFEPQGLVTISTQIPISELTPVQRDAEYRRIRERLLATPGVREVGSVSRLPFMGSNLGSWMWVEGRTTTGGETPGVEYRVASPSYFSTMGIPLRKGRYFDERDDLRSKQVLVINEAAARKFWPHEDPIGKRVAFGPAAQNPVWIEIVGVVGDVRHFGLEIEPRPEVYRPATASPLFAPILVIRGNAEIPVLSAVIKSVNAGLPVYDIFRMQDLVDRSVVQRRFLMSILTAFAGAALLLSAVGIYGTASQSVVLRTQEIGIRMALGASPGNALGMVLWEGLRLTVVGVLLGGVLSLALVRLVRSLLFEVSLMDPLAFLGAVGVLGVIAVGACYLPARRATRVDPVVALRVE
jgi:putative ABC transport system permease protein